MSYLSYPSIVHANIIEISFLDVFNKKKIKSEMMCLTKNQAHYANIFVFAWSSPVSFREL